MQRDARGMVDVHAYAAGMRDDSLYPFWRKLVGIVTILGYILAAFLLIAAFILDLVKKDAAIGTWQESHFAWRIRSVLWAAGLYLVTAPLWLLIIPGWIAWGLISIWFLYRVVRGWLALSDRKAMPA